MGMIESPPSPTPLRPKSVIGKDDAAGVSAAQLLRELECTDKGLSRAEVARRRLEYGQNALTKEWTTALRVLARQFQSALIYFLVVAAILSYATGDLSDGAIITVILVINAVLGFSQRSTGPNARSRSWPSRTAMTLVACCPSPSSWARARPWRSWHSSPPSATSQ